MRDGSTADSSLEANPWSVTDDYGRFGLTEVELRDPQVG